MATAKYPLLLASAVANGVLALGHTTKGLQQFKHASIDALPTMLRSAVKAGWYEGGAFLFIMAILNLKWAQTGIVDVYDKSIAGILVAILAGAAGSYIQSGDKPSAFLLASVAVLQGFGIKSASL